MINLQAIRWTWARMVPCWLTVAMPLLLVVVAERASAQFASTVTFTNSFTAATATDARLLGSARINGGYLKLTTARAGQNGSFSINNLPPAQSVLAFTATFKAALFGGTTSPADGYSFNLVPTALVPEETLTGESGVPNGLSVTFDTWDNGGDGPAVSVLWNGNLINRVYTQVSSTPQGITDVNAALRDVSIRLDPDGTIDVTYGGTPIFQNLTTPYRPFPGARWLMGARTGGAWDNHWIDNLSITASMSAAPPVLTTGSGLNLVGGYVEVPSSPALTTLPFSVTAWMRSTGVGQTGRQTIVSRFNDATGTGYGLYLEATPAGGRLHGIYAGPGGLAQAGDVWAGGDLADGRWHYVAFTVGSSPSVAKLYVDGYLVGQDAFEEGLVSTVSGPTRLGADNAGASLFYGSLDDVMVWNVELSASAVAAGRTVAPVGNAPGLEEFWRFEEGAGLIAADATGRGHNGTLVGAAGWQLEPGLEPSRISGWQLDLNGSYVQVDDIFGNFNVMPITVGAWIRTSDVSTNRRGIAGDFTPDFPDGYSMFVENGNLGAVIHGFSGSIGLGSVPLTAGFVADGSWHYVAFVVDSSSGRLYVDGQLRGSQGWTGSPSGGLLNPPFYIGYQGTLDSNFRGSIDEVSLWYIPFNQSGLQSLMLVPPVGNEADLVFYFRLNEGRGDFVRDQSGNAYDGYIVGPVATPWAPESTPLSVLLPGQAVVDNTTIRGRVATPYGGVTNVAVSAVLGPVQGPGGLAIPDQGTMESTNVVSGSGAMGVLKLTVNIEHPFSGDLEVSLIHPDGTLIRLKNADINDDGEDWVVTFSTADSSGAVLLPLLGKQASGAWRLRVRDAFSDDTGTLNGWSIGAGPAMAVTDSLGQYAFTNLIAATYTVQPERAGFAFTPLTRVTRSGVSGVNFDLLTGFVAGRVSGAGGVPVAGVTISGAGSSVVTDDRGEYRLPSIGSGAFTLTPTFAGHGFQPGQLSPVLGVTNANFAIVSFPVSGRVVDLSSNGVPGVTMTSGGQSAVTDADGNYSIAQVPQGVRVITPSRGTAIFSPLIRSVTSGPAVTGVNFTLQSAPPTITTIPDQVIARNTSTSALRFDVDDRETRPGFLNVVAHSDNTALLPDANLVLGGVGNARTLTATPLSNLSGIVHITITVTDESSLSASSTFTLRVNAQPVAGVGGALSLAGGDFVMAPAGASVMEGKGNFTVELWVSVPTNAGARTLVSQGGAANFFAVSTDSSGQIVVADVWNTGVAFPFGAWHHLAVVKEVGNARLYLDGVLRASRGSTLPLPDVAAAFRVGAKSSAPAAGRWIGLVDELRVWGTSRTALDIASNLNTRVLGNEDNLRTLWRFDERAGSVALDVSSNAFHGAFSGNPQRMPSGVLFNHYTTTEDTSFSDVLQAWDPDADTLTFNLVTPPQRGTVTLVDTNTGAFIYTPNANASGEDRFSFNLSDGYAETEVSLIAVTIRPDTNAPSISFVGNQSMQEDSVLGPMAFNIRDTEVAPSNLTVFGVCSVPSLVPPEGFQFGGSGTNRTVSIQPATNANGSATISLVVSDGKLMATNSFLLTVLPVNDAPTLLGTGLVFQSIPRGSNSAPLPFVIGDVDNPVESLAVTAVSDNPALTPTLTLGGTGNNRTLVVTAGNSSGGPANITVKVSDGLAFATMTFPVKVNQPPVVGSVADVATFRNIPTRPINISISDPENQQMTLLATSSNPTLVPNDVPGTFRFSPIGGGTSLVITPARGQIGVAVITLTVTDSDSGTTTRTFRLVVDNGLDFTFVELPSPASDLPDTSPLGLNDVGQAVGYAKASGALNASNSRPRAVIWNTLSGTPTVSRLNGLLNSDSWATAINNDGQVAGLFDLGITPGGLTSTFPGRPFLYQNNSLTDLSGATAMNSGRGAFWPEINDSGVVVAIVNNVGAVTYDGTTRNVYSAFGPRVTYPLPLPFVFINNAGDLAGMSPSNTTLVRLASGSTRSVNTFSTSQYFNFPSGFNNNGQVFGNLSQLPGGISQKVYLYDVRTDTVNTNVFPAYPYPPMSAYQISWGINDTGELVGQATDSFGRPYAFLFSEGQLFNLQDFVPTNGFQLQYATAINNFGDIVGVGSGAGSSATRAFVLRRQVIVGQPVPPPLTAINPSTQRAYQAPRFEALDGTPQEQAATAAVWSDVDQKLFMIRPIMGRLTWYRTSDLSDTNAPAPVTRSIRAVWPDNPQIHVAGAPVTADPVTASSPYRAVTLNYTTIPGAVLDPGTKTFTANFPGYSVIRYLIAPETAPNAVPDLLTHSNYFQVVRTLSWDDATILSNNLPAVVGTRVQDPRGLAVSTNVSKSGWVVNAISPYDGAGADAAYNRATQTGPIIPVNKDQPTTQDDLIVAYYKRNTTTGAEWADFPVRYNISWPANAAKVVIADPKGSGPLPAAEYPDKRIYIQSNPNLPGYNPNEEHAFLALSGTEEGAFALRNDLNSDATSRSFVLVKYHDPGTGQWKIKPFEVALTDATHGFAFSGEAGQEIQPPYPLSLLSVCTETTVVSGKAFTDYHHKLYAVKGPTADDLNPQVVVRYFYPMQPGFYLDANRDGVNDVPVGSCVGWSGIAPGFATASPIQVTYKISWPTNTPSLEIGETLLNAKRGLPAIKNWASAQVVFDTLNPSGSNPLNNSARLYDPLSTRTLALTNVAGISASYRFPAEIALETLTDGKQSFSELPYYLRTRLRYDPINRWLSWSGVLSEQGLGEPLLLINVMSDTERQRIKQLTSEARFHSIIDALYDLTRNPNRLDLDHDTAPDQALLIGFTTNKAGQVVQENFGSLPKALTAGLPVPNGASPTGQVNYIVLAENNDPALGALPVGLHVVQVDGGPFRGDVKILFPDNVFDERLTLRHSSDFGGDPDRLQFEWWYHSDDADFSPVALPIVSAANGEVTNPRGWRLFKPAKAGLNSITLGDGGESSLFTLVDNWFIVRYRGYNIDGATNWSEWVGDPSSTADTRAAFAPGWVKRVVEGINPFEARTTNFHDNVSSTYSSMLIQAGERYEGDIALNPDGDNLNSIGLIQAYSTVLNRGKRLSIDGLPPVDTDPANNALLLAASRLADLYTLLGNEAFSDAQDPTIGFFSDSLEFGTVATSIFAFENQLDSLLEEELALMRGRDDSASGVGAAPVYNRLLWNFTGAEGEIAYERVYNVGDVNLDGVIDENDARILFPQGHGDAWGHYLTAATTYYDLLRHPYFTWVPRAENVLVAGTSVRVDFLDERKFASVAAAKAKAGTEIVDLTYRSKYVDNPEGQYQGYKDTNPDRAWGVAEWARRAGQGAYFDWLTANSILPSTDPNPSHVGIQKIDRQTVLDIDEIVSQHREIQAQVDKVDKGLNPLGLAKGVVPFDIDPNFLIVGSGIQGRAHFQQIYERAVATMNNSVNMWDRANGLTEALRRQQDSVDDFTANVTDQERDFKSRLIEIFGYPYAGDIGPGKTFPSGYDGPDIYHYMYVGATELTGTPPNPRGLNSVNGYFKPFQDGDQPPSFYFGGDLSTANVGTGPYLSVNYPLASGDWAFTAPTAFGSRRAPGEIQLALSDLLQEETRLKQALNNYSGLIQKIEDQAKLLTSRLELSNRTIKILTDNRTSQVDYNTKITAAEDGQLALRRVSAILSRTSEALVAAIPSDIADAIIPVDNIAHAAYVPLVIASEAMETVADITEGQANRYEKSKEEAQLQSDIDVEVLSQDFEVKQMTAELRESLREEAPMRLETFNQAELVRQTYDRYLAAVASGQRLITERTVFRQRTAALAQQNRYKDIAFRIFRNDALQKYRAQFDLSARYVYLVASAYDYELNFLGGDTRAGRDFFTDIIRQRSIGQMVDDVPVTGRTGLSDPLARLKQNFDVLSPRFGLNNPQLEQSRFSLRKELFRIRDGSDDQWKKVLADAVVPDLWQVPEFRRYCRPFAPEPAGPQPGIVLRFPTTITFGLNFFGRSLGGGDSAYDSSLFSTKINSVGVWFSDYNGAGLATAPRIYLFPTGMDILRSPTGNTLSTREWRVVDQAIPAPFPLGASDVDDPTWIPVNDSLAESFAQIRRFSSFRAYHDAGVYDDTETTKSSRLVGRSVWNTDWVMIIPGGTLLNDPNQGLEQFIGSVHDILISLQSYSYAGD